MGRSNRRRDRWPKRVVETLARAVLSPQKADTGAIRAEGARRILFVRQHNQVGDFLLATPAIRALRGAFPDAEIRVLVAPRHRPLVRNHPDLDGHYVFDKRRCWNPRHAWSFLREIRAFDADLAFVIDTVSFSATSAWLAYLSGARRVVGTDSRPFGSGLSRALYAVEMPMDRDPRIPAVERSLRPLRGIGLEAPPVDLRMCPDPAAERAAAEFLREVGPGIRVAIHSGAGKRPNRWPSERFAQVVVTLLEQGVRPWLVEGPADREVVPAVRAAIGAEVPVLRGVGLDVVAAALRSSSFVLANDTGVLHVAAAVGTPTLALFGPTSSAVWSPPGDHVRAIQSPDGTMQGIEVDEVLAHVLERISAEKSRGRA